MNNAITEIPTNTHYPIEKLPSHAPGLIEWSLLAGVALFLIKNIWQEFQESEKAERELTNKLVDRILKEEGDR